MSKAMMERYGSCFGITQTELGRCRNYPVGVLEGKIGYCRQHEAQVKERVAKWHEDRQWWRDFAGE